MQLISRVFHRKGKDSAKKTAASDSAAAGTAANTTSSSDKAAKSPTNPNPSETATSKNPKETKKMSDKKQQLYLIYQLGTNNWQREGEFAPGSGILHEAHHQAYNSMPNVKSYSIYPSQKQTPHEDPLVEVFHIDHQIPICESVSPVSNYRWHSMSEEEFTAYRLRLEETVYNQMEAAENAEGTSFSLAIAHHTFLNPLVLRNVLRKRVENGKAKVPLVCFVHGTALKMYVHEKEGDNQKEFPLRFLPLMQREKIFDSVDGDGVQVCYAISTQQVDALHEIFPEFPLERTVVSPNGINQNIFHEQKGLTLKDHLKTFDSWYYEGSPLASTAGKIDTSDIEKMVVIVSKFANWKRIDALLKAAKIYEAQPGMEKVALVIVGSGPVEAQKELQDLAYETLKLKKCYFLGPKPQPELAELYTIANIGCFPSKNEPFGMVFVECMACGTPVIGANSGGPKDFVTDEVGELVEESDDSDKLAEYLADAIKRSIDEDWKASKKEACMKLVEEKYSVKGQCKDLLEHTKKILNQKN